MSNNTLSLVVHLLNHNLVNSPQLSVAVVPQLMADYSYIILCELDTAMCIHCIILYGSKLVAWSKKYCNTYKSTNCLQN